MRKIAFIAAIALSPIMAHAGIAINLGAGVLYQNNGTTPILSQGADFGGAGTVDSAQGGTLVLIADLNGNTDFGDIANSTNSWVADPGDLLLARVPLNGFLLGGDGNYLDTVAFDFLAGMNGKKMLLVWYDIPFNPLATGPGNGVFFGTYRTDAILDNSDIAWVVPADGFSGNLNFYTISTGFGSVSDSAGVAGFQTAAAAIPEPASAGIALVGAVLLGRFRRSRKA